MESFIRNDQFNFIRNQIQLLINAHSSVNDPEVINALKLLAMEKVINLFTELNEEQEECLNPLLEIETKDQCDEFLTRLKHYVIPFREVTQQSLKKLMPKAKKLKLPSMDEVSLKDLSYLGWDDRGSQRKYIIAYHEGKAVGLHGHFKPSNKKGICSLCNKLEEVGLFMTQTKGTAEGTFTRKGNYICQDSQKCNQNLTSLEKLNDFLLLCR